MTEPAPSHVDRRLQRGRWLVEAHAWEEAAEVLQALVDDLGDLDESTTARSLVRALTSLSSARLELGRDRGRDRGPPQLLDRARRVAHDHDLRDLYVTVEGARAHGRLRRGDVAEALAIFEQAEPDLAHCSAEDRVRFVLNRGTAHLERGSLTSAAQDLDRAEEEGRAAGLVELAQKARHNRGYLAFLEGDLPRALQLVATPVAAPSEHPAVAALLADPIALMDRARMLLEAGLVEDADDLLEAALDVLADGSRAQDQGEAHLARARVALITGDLAFAADQTERAGTCFTRRDNTRWLRRATFTRLAVVVEQLQAATSMARRTDRRIPSALTAGRADALRLVDRIMDLVDEAGSDGDGEIAVPARFMAAEAAVLAGDVERARRVLAGVEPPDDEAISVRLRWHRARAGVAASSGGDVHAIVRSGLSDLSRAQSRLGSVDLRTAIAIHGRELAELGVGDALSRGDANEIHEAVERSHASSTRLSPVRAEATDRERGQLARLRRASDALWMLDARARPDEEVRLRAEIAHLQHGLRQRDWGRAGSVQGEDVADLAAVRERLVATDAVAASFTTVGSELVAVRISPSSIDIVEVGEAGAIGAIVDRIRSDLQAMVLPGVPADVLVVMRRSVDRGLAQLDEAVLAPLDVGRHPLVVVPHGPLALVPWPLLDSRAGLATTSAPCLSEWVRPAHLHARGDASGEVVAVAGPGLQRADGEVAAVAASWPRARTLVGAAATRTAVRRALRTADVVHLATHGTHQVSSPLFSSLRLGDGPVFAHELGTDALARLVVLSACEVGSHTIRRGDEPLGMTAALLQAEVPTVLASVARVSDQAAHDVMIDVHERLAAGASPAAALGVAVAVARDSGHAVPFTCVGVGLEPLRSPSP